MERSCGAETTEHHVVRDKAPAGRFAKCRACGRVHWWWMSEKLHAELTDAEPDHWTTIAERLCH